MQPTSHSSNLEVLNLGVRLLKFCLGIASSTKIFLNTFNIHVSTGNSSILRHTKSIMNSTPLNSVHTSRQGTLQLLRVNLRIELFRSTGFSKHAKHCPACDPFLIMETKQVNESFKNSYAVYFCEDEISIINWSLYTWKEVKFNKIHQLSIKYVCQWRIVTKYKPQLWLIDIVKEIIRIFMIQVTDIWRNISKHSVCFYIWSDICKVILKITMLGMFHQVMYP